MDNEIFVCGSYPIVTPDIRIARYAEWVFLKINPLHPACETGVLQASQYAA